VQAKLPEPNQAMSVAPVETARDTDEQHDAPIEPARRSELLQDCQGLVVTRLSTAISDALKRVGDELTSLALRNRDRETQQALLDAVTLVRRHHEDIERSFRELFADIFVSRVHGQGEAAASSPTGLALVDDSVIEEKIAIDRIIQRARSKLDPDEVLGVRARLGVLAAGDWFDEARHPAAPEAVFEALRRTLAQLDADAGVRDALLDALEPHVSSNLGDLYATLNERLRSNHVLPRIRPRLVTSASSPGAHARPDPLDAASQGFDAGAVAAAATGLGASAGPDVGADSLPADPFAALMARLAEGSSPARQAAARLLADPAIFAAGNEPPAVEPELLQSLNRIQSGAGGGGAGGPKLVSELLEQSRSKGSSLDQLTVEIVSLVFDHIYADRRLPDAVKQQLLRLQVVAVKAALIDRSFFATRRHPMRRLLDDVCRAASDPDADVGPDSALVAGVAEIVDWLIASFESELSVFEDAAMRLELLLSIEGQRRAERDSALARQAERLEAIAVSQESARAEISARLADDTPVFLVEFLERWWPKVLATARVEDGDLAWNDALACVEGLVWSVAPKASEEIPKLASLLPKLIGQVKSGLNRAAVDNAEKERFFNELLGRHTEVIQRAKSEPGHGSSRRAAASAGRSRPAASPRTASPQDPVAPEVARWLGDLRRGDSLELLESDGSRRLLRVSWVSPTRRLFILTRFPEVARPIERAELARWFETGRARLADAQTSVERAIGAIAAGGMTARA